MTLAHLSKMPRIECLPLRAVKGFGGMIFKDHLPDGDIVELTIPAEQFFLAALRIALVCLFVGRYPDI